MTAFIIIFLLIYTSMHAVFYSRIRILLADNRLLMWGVLCFFMVMILSPILCRVVEKMGHEPLARMIAYVGYNWMGFIFLGFVCALAMHAYDLIIYGCNLLFHVRIPVLFAKIPTLIMIAGITLLCLWGAWIAQGMKIERIRLVTSKLPPEISSLRIVQISDIHLGLMIRKKQLEFIANQVKSLEPDILVCTGDLVDGNFHHISNLADVLNQIRPKYGKFAVTGNHEYYAGFEESLKFLKMAGFNVLQSESVSVDGIIHIAGVDDHTPDKSETSAKLLSSIQDGRFILFLKHRPIISEGCLGLFDLQLSGHTHSGQIFPFNIIVGIPFPYLNGYYDLGKGSAIYTNRGTGTWGPQIRIPFPPEITVIEIHRHDL